MLGAGPEGGRERAELLNHQLGLFFKVQLPLTAPGVISGALIIYDDLTEPVAGWPPPGERLRFPERHPRAQRAVARVAALSPEDRAELVAEIERAIRPFPDWLAELNRKRVAVLCKGENHEPYLRRFLADRVFATLNADVLLLEATPREAGRIRARVEDGDERVMPTQRCHRSSPL